MHDADIVKLLESMTPPDPRLRSYGGDEAFRMGYCEALEDVKKFVVEHPAILVDGEGSWKTYDESLDDDWYGCKTKPYHDGVQEGKF